MEFTFIRTKGGKDTDRGLVPVKDEGVRFVYNMTEHLTEPVAGPAGCPPGLVRLGFVVRTIRESPSFIGLNLMVLCPEWTSIPPGTFL